MKKSHTMVLDMALLLGAQLLWSQSTLATDYYVDANRGHNTYSGLTPSEALANLKHAMKLLRAGDTLYVRAGEYHDTVYLRSTDRFNQGNEARSGTSFQPITIKAYQNEKPVIGENALIVVEDLRWWVFEGLIFQSPNPLRFGVSDSSLTPSNKQCTSTAGNITIRRNRFQHVSSTGIKIKCGRHIKIQDNIFENLRSRKTGKDIHGIMLAYHANDIVISGNRFIDIGADGIQLLDKEGAHFTDIVITDNDFEIQRPYRYRDESGRIIPADQQPFENVGENAIDIKKGPGPILISKNIVHGFRPTTAQQDASGANGVGIVLHNQARGITLRKNYFYNNQVHLSVTKGNHSSRRRNADSLLHNNVFGELAAPDSTDSIRPRGLSLMGVRNIRVFNNTFQSRYGDKVNLLSFVDIGSVELFNNALSYGGIGMDDASQVNLLSNYNAWAKITTKTVSKQVYPGIIGANDIITDNLLIDPATWVPIDGSLLIDAGSSIEVITSDYHDMPIVGAGHDIGAVEFVPSQQGTGSTADNQRPVVSIISPADDSIVSGIIRITVAADDNVGVSKVNLVVDGNFSGTDTTAPYRLTWDSSRHARGSTVKLRVRAFDDAGNVGTDVMFVTIE